MSVALQSYKPVAGGESAVPAAPRAYTIQDLGLPLDGGPLPTLAWRFSQGEHRIVVSGSGWGR
mgnify:CR=1 FL=1